MPPVFTQSLPLCYALSAIGGILEVGSTAVLAVPDAREKEGVNLPWWLPKVALASNVVSLYYLCNTMMYDVRNQHIIQYLRNPPPRQCKS